MILLQRQRHTQIVPLLVPRQESDAVSAAQRCAIDARERLRVALADNAEVQRVTDELRELRSHADFEFVLLCTLKGDV